MSEKHKVLLKQWKQLIEERMKSGLTVKQWCEANGYSKHAYYYWLQCIRRETFPQAMGPLSSPVGNEKGASIVEIPSSFLAGTYTDSENMSGPAAIIRSHTISQILFFLHYIFLLF